MTTRGQAHYLRLFDSSTTYFRWQSYYINQTVTLDSASWSYYPFTVSGLLADSGSSANDVSIQVPGTQLVIDYFSAAISNNRLCDVFIYDFDSSLSQDAPQSSQVLIGRYVGEVVEITGDFENLSVRLGSSLSPVGAQVPPRIFTTSLVGAPIRL